MDRLKQHIFLIGFMGSGKSTVSAKLAQKLHVNQVEMDAAIEGQQNMAVKEIFAVHGEKYFRDLESRFLTGLSEEEPAVVSCGGGAVLRQNNVEAMKKSGKIVLLTARPETILERVRYSKDRPILNGNMNLGFIEELMEKRRAVYEAAADFSVVTDGRNTDEICQDILELCCRDL